MREFIMLIAGGTRSEQVQLENRLKNWFHIHTVDTTSQISSFLDEHVGLVEIILYICGTENPKHFIEGHRQSRHRSVPLVLFSQNDRFELDALNAGAWDYLRLSADDQILQARINNVLKRSKSFCFLEGGSERHYKTEQVQNECIRMRHLVNSIPGGIAIYRMTDRFETLYFSDGIPMLTGHTREEYTACIEENAADIVYEPDRNRLIHAVMHTLMKGEPIDEVYRIHHKDGHLVWVRLNGHPIGKSENGVLVHAIFQAVSPQLELYQDLLNEIQTAVYVCDVQNYEILYVNDKIRSIADIEPFQAAGQKCYHVLFGLDKPCSFCRLQDMKKNAVLEREFTYCRNNRTYNMKGSLIEWNNLTAHVEFIEDITEEKEAEFIAAQAKERSEKQYRRQMEVINSINDTNLIGKGYCNLTENRLVSYTKLEERSIGVQNSITYDEALDMVGIKITDDEERTHYYQTFNREALLAQYANDKTEIETEFRWRLTDGSVVWVLGICRLISEPETGDVLAFVYSYDISDKKTTQEMIDAVVKLDYDYLILLDCPTGRSRTYSNSGTTGLPSFGGEAYEEAVRRYAKRYLPPDEAEDNIRDMSIQNIQKQLSDKDSFTIYANIAEENGRISRKKIQFSYMDRANQKVLISRVDITDIYEKDRALLKELQEATENAVHANQAKTEFLSRMSHDIRTPLNAVIGLAELGKMSESIEEMREELQEISISGSYLLSIINDVLEMSKIESKALTLHPVVVYLPKFINETLAIITPAIKSKHIQFQFKKTRIVSDYMFFDETYVRQVVVNLLSNAVKFTPENGLVELELTNITRSPGKVRNRMIVRDSGIGISKEFLPKVFSPFEQENNGVDTNRQGTGLGLSIVKSIVALMNGTIRVESEKGKGTSFIVEWELQTAEAPDVLPAKQQNTDKPRSLSGVHVLLCEDHPLNTKIAVQLLQKEGMLVTPVGNGLEALNLFTGSAPGHFDIILMDIRMPVMDGLEAARRIRASNQPDANTIPIIAMTANAFAEDKQASFKAGMNAHLSKPIVAQKLYSEIRSALA